ncbi:MAG: hypothetical protein IPL83_03355 [Bdellovibrionales bacterium]|nr:hypothetical protein [Bdellovibrionales bacterium]
MWKFLKSIFIGILISACTEKGRPIHTHEGARGDSRQKIEPAGISGDISVSDRFSDLPEIERRATVTRDLISEILSPLALRILSPKEVEAPKSYLQPDWVRALDLFNRLLLKEIAKNPSSSDVQRLIEEYVAAVSVSCEQVVMSCAGIRNFRRSPSSAEVLKVAAKRAVDVTEYYRRLALALALKNQQFDPELLEMLTYRFAEGRSKMISDDRRALLKSVVEFSLSNLQMTSRSKSENRGFLERLGALNLIFRGDFGLSEVAKGALAKLISSSEFLYDSSGKLRSEIISIITENLSEKEGFKERQNLLSSQRVFLPTAVGFSPIDRFDEYVFIVDRIFNQKMSVDLGAELFLATKRDQSQLASTIQNYARIQFLFSLYKATLLAKEKIFSAPVESERLLWNAINESSSIGKVWSDLRANLGPLEKLSVAITRGSEGESSIKRNQSLFGEIDKSIKLVAVYPHMMILFYILSKKNFEVHLKMPSYSKTLYSSDLMSYLYRGDFPPLFNYTLDKNKISSIEMFYAFDFALRTNLFGLSGIDPDQFVADAVQRFGENNVEYVRRSLSSIRQRFQQAPSYRTFRNICNEFGGSAPEPRGFYFSEVASSPYFGNLIEPILMRLSSKSGTSGVGAGSLAKESQGLNFMDVTFSESVERLRIDLESALRMARAMKASYESYLRGPMGMKSGEISKRTSKIDGWIYEVTKLRRDYLAEASIRYQETGRCLRPLVAKEEEIQNEVIRAEQAYLRQVYKAIRALRRQGGDKILRDQEIRKKYIFKGLPEEFPGLDKIDENGYLYHRLDLLVRIGRYISDGLKTDSETIAAIAPNVKMNFGDSMISEIEVGRPSEEKYLSFTDTEEEFVKSGMRLIFRVGRPMLNWNLNGSRIAGWEERISSMVSLYRLESSELTNKGQSLFSADEIIEEHRGFLKLTQISPFEVQLYNSLQRQEKYEPIFFSTILLNIDSARSRIREILGLFDFPSLLVTSDILGFNYSLVQLAKDRGVSEDPQASREIERVMPRREGYFSLGRTYFENRSARNRGRLMLEFNPELDRHLDREIRHRVDWEIGRVNHFRDSLEKKISEYKNLSVEEQPRFDLNLRESTREPLVNGRIFSDFDLKLGRFHRETQNCFRNNKCMDFQ